jgi:hypothetical protein
LDDAVLETWYEIRPEAIDNILDATPVTAALRDKGRFVPQVGSKYIERTVKYGNQSTQNIEKGDTISSSVPDLETAAFWNFRWLATPVQGSLYDDCENAGKFKNQDYIMKRLQDARDSMAQQLESDIMDSAYRSADTFASEASKYIQGIPDIVTNSTYNDGDITYGGINRSDNSWWRINLKQWTSPREVNLLSDMRNLYNTCYAHQEPINFILTDQTTFELYEEFAEDKTQLVKDTGSRLADLGYEVLRYKGKPLLWSDNVGASYNPTASSDMMMLNLNFIDFVYDPNCFFDMTDFKKIHNQLEREAQLVTRCNLVSSQLRRHGLLYA